MATTAFSRILAATAAVLIGLLGLSGCGGTGNGDDKPSALSAAPVKSITEALSGPAVDNGTTFDGRPRMQALSAPASQSVAVTQPVIDFSFVFSEGATKPAQAQALAAAEAPSAGTITWDQLADYVERTYPGLFPGHQASQPLVSEGVTYVVRYYPVLPDGKGNYIGVTPDGRVYGYGQFTNYVLTQYGDLATWTGPRLVSAKIVSSDGTSVEAGTSEVSAKGTKLVLGYDKPLGCVGVGGTGKIGTIIATISCDPVAKTVTVVPGLPGELRWPFGTKNTVTVGGFLGQDGLPSPQATTSFTTRSVAAGSSTRVYVANRGATADGGHDVSIIDAATLVVKPVNLADVLNGVTPQHLTVDVQAGVLYVGAGGDRFYRVDIETGVSLAPFYPDPANEYPGYWHTVQGLVIAGSDICAAMGRRDLPEYVYRNRLLCWNRFTLEPSFRSNSDYLAGRSMVVMDLVAVPERNAFYAIAAETLAYTLKTDSTGQYLKEEFVPGSAGTVYELNADTKAVVRTFAVGAGPRSAVYDATRKRLIVANSGLTTGGKATLSLIDLETGQVTTQILPGFVGDQRPMLPVITRGELWITDYVSAVVALDPGSFAEKRRVQVGAFTAPEFFAEVGGRLYVSIQPGRKVAVVDLVTYSVASLTTGGYGPVCVVGFVPSP